MPPDGYPRIRVVSSFEALVAARFTDGQNAICWPRTLPGDFGEILQHLDVGDGITNLDDETLLAMPLSPAGRTAVEALLADQRRLRALGLDPGLDCVREYARETDPGPVPTDVYSFHVDRATVAIDTYLCSYTAPASEGLRNDEARRCVDIPAIRAQLLERFGGDDDDTFVEHLQENCFDLHYAPIPAARPFSFGVGNLWRLAVQHPGSRVPAFIHRAPRTLPGQPPRLLLIS